MIYSDNASIANAGRMVGDTYGIYLNGLAGSVSNDGVIKSGYIGVELVGGGHDFGNTGRIVGDAIGVLLRGDVVTVNDGLIRGGIGLEFISAGGGLVVNSGRLVGTDGVALQGLTAAIELHNSGVIRGDVVLSSGDDIYKASRDGTVVGDVLGGDGDDLMVGSGGDDRLIGGSGENYLFGGAGDDFLDNQSGDWSSRARGGAGDDRILINGSTGYGGAGNDTIIGTGVENSMFGEGGRDRLVGGSGRDYMVGGSQNDTLIGNAGSDLMEGGAGRDVLRGGPGEDYLQGGPGNDVLIGGGGADYFVFQFANEGRDVVRGFEDGVDKFLFDVLGGYDLLNNGFASAADFAAAAVSASGRDAVIDLSVIAGVKGTITVKNAAGLIDGDDFLL